MKKIIKIFCVISLFFISFLIFNNSNCNNNTGPINGQDHLDLIKIDPDNISDKSGTANIWFNVQYSSQTDVWISVTVSISDPNNQQCSLEYFDIDDVNSNSFNQNIWFRPQTICNIISPLCCSNGYKYSLLLKAYDNPGPNANLLGSSDDALDFTIGNVDDPNRRPWCIGPNPINKEIEYDCDNDWNTSDQNWDQYMQEAWVTKCNTNLNFHNYQTTLTNTEQYTDGTYNDAMLQLQNFWIYHHNTTGNYPYYIASIYGFNRYDWIPNGGDPLGITSGQISFIFVHHIFETVNNSDFINAKRLVVAHELGHNVAYLTHGNDQGNGSDCCIMFPSINTCGAISQQIYFCDFHACLIY